ncbi:MAG TPA: hypothetical protein VEX68_00935, partial [Bryobacteraceae bacterium]|nr:hypothetical protein [Bryobacteraceae bacterium]
MNELLSPCAFVTETAVLTKRGDLFSVLRVRGVDAECLEPDTLDDICRRFEGTLRILGPEYRVMQYIVKRDSPPLPLSTSTDTLARARSSWLQSHATQLFSISLYLVVLRMRPPQEQAKLAFLSYFSTRQTLSASRQELSRDADQLAAAIDSLTIQLSGTIRPEQLDQRSTVRFLQSLVNLSPSKSEPFGEIPKFHLDQHLSQSGIECWPRHLKKDQYFIKMLSLVDPPSRTFPHLLRGLLAVPCNMIVCSEWKR